MYAKKIITDRLHQLLDLPLGKIFLSRADLQMPNNAIIQPWPRLIFLISGEKSQGIANVNGSQNITLFPGDGYFCPSQSWEIQNWKGQYELLCLVLRANYLRFSLYIKTNEQTKPDNYFIHTDKKYSDSLGLIFSAMDEMKNNSSQRLRNNLSRAAAEFALDELSAYNQISLSKPQLQFREILSWLENSFQEDIDRNTAAEVFKLSEGYISQLFKKYGQKGFNEFLTEFRMNFACNLLRNSYLTVSEIAFQSGYNNCVHFVRRFSQLKQISPGQYRSKTRSN